MRSRCRVLALAAARCGRRARAVAAAIGGARIPPTSWPQAWPRTAAWDAALALLEGEALELRNRTMACSHVCPVSIPARSTRSADRLYGVDPAPLATFVDTVNACSAPA